MTRERGGWCGKSYKKIIIQTTCKLFDYMFIFVFQNITIKLQKHIVKINLWLAIYFYGI